MIPGIHPTMVSSVTNKIDPHPLSKTAKGGKMMQRITFPRLMTKLFNYVLLFFPFICT